MDFSLGEDTQVISLAEFISKLEGGIITIESIISHIIDICNFCVGYSSLIRRHEDNFRRLREIHTQLIRTLPILQRHLSYIYSRISHGSQSDGENILIEGADSWWYRVKANWVQDSPHTYFTIYLSLEVNYQDLSNRVYTIRDQILV